LAPVVVVVVVVSCSWTLHQFSGSNNMNKPAERGRFFDVTACRPLAQGQTTRIHPRVGNSCWPTTPQLLRFSSSQWVIVSIVDVQLCVCSFSSLLLLLFRPSRVGHQL
jgi:hypothetical protein